MNPAALLLGAALLASAPDPPLPEVYGAIFYDLMVNGMIGNGNDLAGGNWYWGHDMDHSPTIRISDVRCWAVFGQRECRLTLTRTPDPASRAPAEDAREHRRLLCAATLERRREQGRSERWAVLHLPPDPESGGHSETSLHCRVGR